MSLRSKVHQAIVLTLTVHIPALGTPAHSGNTQVLVDHPEISRTRTISPIGAFSNALPDALCTLGHLDDVPPGHRRTILGRPDDGVPISYEVWIDKGRRILKGFRDGTTPPSIYRDYEVFDREGWVVMEELGEYPKGLHDILGSLSQERGFDEWWVSRSVSPTKISCCGF